MGQRGRAARWARLGNGRHWNVDQCGARTVRPSWFVPHSHSPLTLPHTELMVFSCVGVGWVIGPFWAWKVGPVTTAVTPAK